MQLSIPSQINALGVVRREWRLSRKLAARLLGHRHRAALARYERGERLPSLRMALKLEILYRRPVAFLYPELYCELRQQVRRREAERLMGERGLSVQGDGGAA